MQRDPRHLDSKIGRHAFVVALTWNPPNSVKPSEVGSRKQNPGGLVSFAQGKGLLSAWVGFFSTELKNILAM